jgi:hypothetical protein
VQTWLPLLFEINYFFTLWIISVRVKQDFRGQGYSSSFSLGKNLTEAGLKDCLGGSELDMMKAR